MVEKVVKGTIPEKDLTKEEIEKDLGLPLSELLGDVQLFEKVIEMNKFFRPFNRAVHVFGEAQRVLSFREICLNKELTESEKTQRLGELMS